VSEQINAGVDTHHPTADEISAAEALAAMRDKLYTPKPPVIVGECSRTYTFGEPPRFFENGEPDLIATRFELMIKCNAERGYKLRDWRFAAVPAGVQVGHIATTEKVCETIVAIFDLVEH